MIRTISLVAGVCLGGIILGNLSACVYGPPKPRLLLVEEPEDKTLVEEEPEDKSLLEEASDREAERWWEREVAAFESIVKEKSSLLVQAHIEKAKGLYRGATDAHGVGDYKRAEALLKESLYLYPFLIESNLLLGKIFLIRGSATRDYILINNAKLMFEMALALDPGVDESRVLLDLFDSSVSTEGVK